MTRPSGPRESSRSNQKNPTGPNPSGPEVSTDREALARRIFEDFTYGLTTDDLAEEYGMSKRQMSELLAEFGLKFDRSLQRGSLDYEARKRHPTWTRPCSVCGSTKPRLKGLFRCGECRRKEAALYDGTPEHMLIGGSAGSRSKRPRNE